jgi:hypothetical protein
MINLTFALMTFGAAIICVFELGCDKATAKFLGHPYRSRSTVYSGACAVVLVSLWLVYNLL